MNRREFLSAAGVALATYNASASASPGPVGPSRPPLKMHLGTQQGPTTPEMLQFFKRHGCDHICGYPLKSNERGYWTLEELERTRDLCEKHGVRMEMVALPFLTSSHIDHEKRGAIMLGESPERDRDIADIHKMIEACAKAGVLVIQVQPEPAGRAANSLDRRDGADRRIARGVCPRLERIRRSLGPGESLKNGPGNGSSTFSSG